MEDYDKFVQHRLSNLRRSEEKHNKPPAATSLIRFYGEPILPPLLSGEQREEMQLHRDVAQKAAVHRQLKDEIRLAYVQTILQRVQLRKTPTLEELLRESEINTCCSHNTSGGSVSQSDVFIGTKDDVLLSSPSRRKEKDAVSVPPLTSTTYSAFFSSNITPQQSYQDGCLMNQHHSQPRSQLSQQSSGYVTHENVEYSSSEGTYNNNISGFFLHNASNTIAKMPDIINHPPIDGEELERSGLESALLQEDSEMCDQLPAEVSVSNHLDSTDVGDNLPFTRVLDLDHSLDTSEGPVSASRRVSDNPELPQTLSTQRSLAADLHVQHGLPESELADNHADKAQPCEEPYRLSLQALLKKSQEYRRRQRMLRNQAKTTKIQDRTQEQPRAEEQSLSDKENNEFPHRQTVTAEGRRTKERKGTFTLSEDTSLKKSWQNENVIEANLKSESTHLIGDRNTKEMSSVEEETILKNNNMNNSKELTQISASLSQPPTSTGTSPAQEAFYLSTCPAAVYKGGGQFHTIPSPTFCRSPVHCKSKGSIQDGDALDEVTQREAVANTSPIEDHKVEEFHPGHKNSLTAGVSTVERDETSSSKHTESNLSSVLIWDLESTLTENLENHGQTEGNTRSEFANNSHQSDCSIRAEKVRNDEGDSSDAEQEKRFEDWLRRKSLKHSRISDRDDVPLVVEVQQTEAVSELKLVELSATESEKKETCEEGPTKSCGQRGGCRKPTAKCILSATQRRRIPNVFRNVPADASVLSDTSNHPSRNAGGHDSINQSYDVDAPSNLWLLEGSGCDTDCLVREKPLTPESRAGGQGSSVKRRLLMHTAEEKQGASPCRGVSSVVLPYSSTPTAMVRQQGRVSGADKQEQLKLAHAAQVRALQEQHRRQQEELLQALAERYRLLQNVSFPCSISSSRLGDTLTFSPLSQPCSPLSERYRHLLLAAVRGFLTRRLLKTERVVQLVRTIRDTRQVLQALQQQSPGRADLCSRQDLLLQERVTLQLRAARYEVHDIFFSLSAGERMQLISWDRELAKERELRRQSGHSGSRSRKSSLSTATQKSLERKRGLMIQRKAVERFTAVTRTGRSAGSSAEQLPETKPGKFRVNPKRVPKNSGSSRPR